MSIKLPGVKTGTVKGVTDSGRYAHWVPKGELTLIASQSEADQSLPLRIAANPSAEQFVEAALNRATPLARSAARIFVGFNVGDKPVWRAGQVYLAGFLLREKQLQKTPSTFPAFSFYVGLGAFPGQGAIVSSERSAQFVFINFNQKYEDFARQIGYLGAELASVLHQESTLVELSREGQVTNMDYVDVDAKDRLSVKEAKAWLDKNAYRIEKSVYAMK